MPGLAEIYGDIEAPSASPSGAHRYATREVPDHPNYRVGRDAESLPCLLITVRDAADEAPTPIRMENIDALFDLPCSLREVGQTGGASSEGAFTVIRCRQGEEETVRYFWFFCETILRVLGDTPTYPQITQFIHQLAELLQKIRQPATKSINGLLGELFLLSRSGDPIRALGAWHSALSSRFDFSDGNARVEVKTTSNRTRIHSFSYDQCNPPDGTIAVAASLQVEQASGGISLDALIREIEAQVSAHPDLVIKLHDTVASTLGESLRTGLTRCFDLHLMEDSLQFFDLRAIPAIRGPLPAGVSDVRFQADLSGTDPASTAELAAQDPAFRALLPA